MLNAIIGGIIGGIGWSVLGYVNKKKKDPETSFDIKGLGRPVVIGVLIGLYSVQTGSSFDILSNSAVFMPLTAVADKIVSFVIKFFKK